MIKNILVVAIASSSMFVHAGPVQLVTGDDYAPYADSKLREGGLTTELVKKAFTEMKQEIKIEWRPWARGLAETKDGTFAATFPYLRTAEREKDFDYSSPVNTIQDRAFVKKGNEKKFDFKNIASLAGTTYCLPLGWAPVKILDEMLKNGKLKKSNPKDISTCVKMVATDRADFYITDEFQGKAAMKTADIEAGMIVLADAPPLTETTLHLIVGKSSPGGKELIANFDKAMATLRKNGVYDKVIASHIK